MASETAKEIVSELLARSRIAGRIEEEVIPDLSVPYLNIVTDEARFLAGVNAANLAALEYLAKRIMERATGDPRSPLMIDVNSQRLHYFETLRLEAKNVARKVRLYRAELALKPMSAFERRIIHITLAEYPDIITQSIGEGPSRRVVVKPYP